MNKEELHLQINSRRLSKKEVDHLVGQLETNADLVENLLNAVAAEDKEGTFNASWVFDHLMRSRLDYLLPYLNEFTLMLSNLKSESCIRPMAHVCEMITEAYFIKKIPEFRKELTETHLERLVSNCFDWLIGEHKIAAKVFAMTSLFYLGKKFDWVHPELTSILEQTVNEGTTGYRNRAEKTLIALKSLGH